jgi:hypothetical protein
VQLSPLCFSAPMCTAMPDVHTGGIPISRSCAVTYTAYKVHD